MVKLASPGELRPESEAPRGGMGTPDPAPDSAVKLEIEDPLEEEHGPLNKRCKLSAPLQQHWSTDASMVASQPAHYNPFDEPSLLGLHLRKSPSLLNLIQMRLSQGNAAESCVTSGDRLEVGKKDFRLAVVSVTTDKLKASNFPATLLRIGTWEFVARYEGDLVAKCYFAKHKLVWEVLDGGLKNKIEIQWPDITALKGTCPENGPGTLDIVLARQPLFFRETNPQPRKHTLWQATSDFTGGQASLHRRHFLQCSQGLLSKHFEKLIQCDPRLNSLSRQPDIILDSPYFESRCSVFEDQDETKCHGFDHIKGECGSPFSRFHDAASPSAGLSSSKSEVRDSVRTPDPVSPETPSPSSVMDSRAIEENASSETDEFKDLNNWDQFKVPGLHQSMSMSDLVNRFGHCISEQRTSGNPLFLGDAFADKTMLEEITRYLFSSDSQHSAASDESSLMSRVNSLCRLLQKDPATIQNLQINIDDSVPRQTSEPTIEGEFNDAAPCKQPSPAISRTESVGDLLLLHHLPRIASLPQFLFSISRDTENKSR